MNNRHMKLSKEFKDDQTLESYTKVCISTKKRTEILPGHQQKNVSVWHLEEASDQNFLKPK